MKLQKCLYFLILSLFLWPAAMQAGTTAETKPNLNPPKNENKAIMAKAKTAPPPKSVTDANSENPTLENQQKTLIQPPPKTPAGLSLWRELSKPEAQKQEIKIPSLAPLIEKAQPAVVVIITTTVTESGENQPMVEVPGLPGPFRFFAPMPSEKQQGMGSGFIINTEGYGITNEHVVAGAQTIKVKVGSSPQEYFAKVIGSDEALDIALIRILTNPKEKKVWPYLPLGNSEELRVGDFVVALGSPLGLEQSANFGIISQKHRGDIRPSGRVLFVDLIQMQTFINPGNSGGPVLNLKGEVVAISESIMARGQGISFAVPMNVVKQMLPKLMSTGTIEKAWLGIEPGDLTPQLAQALGLKPAQKGAVVRQVIPGTPAAKAKLHVKDVITEFDGKPVSDAFHLRQIAAYTDIGKVVKLKVYRKEPNKPGHTLDISVTLEKRPDQNKSVVPTETQRKDMVQIKDLGLGVITTPTEVQQKLNLPHSAPGALVFTVTPNSLAQLAAILPEDVIIRLNDHEITSAQQLAHIVEKTPNGAPLFIILRRNEATRFVELYKGDKEE